MNLSYIPIKTTLRAVVGAVSVVLTVSYLGTLFLAFDSVVPHQLVVAHVLAARS